MADVGRFEGRSDRGQLILVTALGLAILFVSLALIVNTAIYTENLATRSSDIGGGTDAVRYHDAVESGVGGIIEFANFNENASHGNLQTELSAGIEAFENRSGMQYAMSDRSVEVRLDSTVNGTRIAQTDSARDFSNTSGVVNWTVVEDVSNLRAFRLEITQSALVGTGGDPFRVVVDDGSDTWNLTLSTTGSDVVATVDGPSVSDSCSVTAGSAWVNVTAGTLAGTECDALATIGDGLSTPYEIRYQEGDHVAGTYSVVVDNATLADSSGPHLVDDGNGQPFATHAVYSANLTVIYQSPRLFYNTKVRVAPGEANG